MNWCMILPWLIGIGAAILGGLIGYYLTRPKMLFYKSGLENKSKDYDNLNGQYNATLSAKAEVEELNTGLNAELETERNRINRLNLSLEEATAVNQKLEGDVKTNLGQIATLNATIQTKDTEFKGLETKMTTALAAAKEDCAKKQAELNKTIADLKASLAAKDSEVKKGAEKMSFAASSNQSKIADLEGTINGLNANLTTKEREVNTLQAKINELEVSLAAKDSEVKKGAEQMSFAASSNQSLVSDLEGKVNDLNVSLAQKENEAGALQTKINELEASLEAKDSEMKKGAEKMSFAASSNQSKVADLEGTIDGLNTNLTTKESEINALRTKIGELEANFATKESKLNSKIDALEEEATANLSSRGIAMDSSAVDTNELTNIKANLGLIPFGNIGSSAATADDLTKITSISDVEEMKLNLAQINSYKQVSRFQEAEITAIANATGLDAERIKNEDWVGQARTLLLGAIIEKDDLKKIEGIGPKIEGLCNNNGIYTFEELAKTAVSAIQHILTEGGPRYRLANPGTWPMQARLAADGDWEQLDILQDILDKGIFKKG